MAEPCTNGDGEYRLPVYEPPGGTTLFITKLAACDVPLDALSSPITRAERLATLALRWLAGGPLPAEIASFLSSETGPQQDAKLQLTIALGRARLSPTRCFCPALGTVGGTTGATKLAAACHEVAIARAPFNTLEMHMANSMEPEPQAFQAFEHAGWQLAAPQYDEDFEQLTTQTIEPLLTATAVTKGTLVLDVATGPGYVARAAGERGATVVGIDFSRAMLELACRNAPAVEFREADAAALPFGDASFEVVTMNYGLLHLSQPERAVAEAHRVLRPGGRFAFSVWAGPEVALGLGITLAAIQAHGNLAVPLPAGPPFFRFSDANECKRLLSEAGFVRPLVQRIPQVWRLACPEALYEVMLHATVRTAGLLRAQTPEALAQIRQAIIDGARKYREGSGVEIPMAAMLASAHK